MITFSRSQLVGMEFLDEETVRFHGTQEDHIYAMEVAMDVRIADGRILAIQGWMKRYTTPVCPRAVDRLQDAVGISLRDPSWMPLVMREIGRKGCEHFAEINLRVRTLPRSGPDEPGPRRGAQSRPVGRSCRPGEAMDGLSPGTAGGDPDRDGCVNRRP